MDRRREKDRYDRRKEIERYDRKIRKKGERYGYERRNETVSKKEGRRDRKVRRNEIDCTKVMASLPLWSCY